MRIQWDRKVGVAAVVGVVGSLSILVTIGIAWGSMNGKIEASAILAAQAKTESAEVNKGTSRRDEKISMQAERLGKIETSIQFIVPSLQRIEAKLDSREQKLR